MPDISSSKIIQSIPLTGFYQGHLRLQFANNGISAASTSFPQYGSSNPDTVNIGIFETRCLKFQIIQNIPIIVFYQGWLRLEFVYCGISAASPIFPQYQSSYPDLLKTNKYLFCQNFKFVKGITELVGCFTHLCVQHNFK